MKVKRNYFKEEDILSLYFGEKKEVEHSRELGNVTIIVDFNKKDDVVGIEIYDFLEAIKQSDKEINEIFERPSKKNSKKENRKHPYKKVRK